MDTDAKRALTTIEQIKSMCEKKVSFYNHGMIQLDEYLFAKGILDLINENARRFTQNDIDKCIEALDRCEDDER